jgi:GAF domain-containing protein
MDQEQKAMVERISESIRQSLDLDEILTTTVNELCHAISASRCCLALVDNHSTIDLADDELMFNYVSWDARFGGAPLKHRSIMITKHSMMRMILELVSRCAR